MGVVLELPAMAVELGLWNKLPGPERAILIALQELRKYQTSADSKEGLERVSEMIVRAESSSERAWDASFVSWCLEAALVKPSDLEYRGSTFAWISWAKAHRRVKRTDPRRGDLFYFDRPGKSHIGFVLGRQGNFIATLEGNVFEDGRLEGSQVALILRSVDEADGYIFLGKNLSSEAIAA